MILCLFKKKKKKKSHTVVVKRFRYVSRWNWFCYVDQRRSTFNKYIRFSHAHKKAELFLSVAKFLILHNSYIVCNFTWLIYFIILHDLKIYGFFIHFIYFQFLPEIFFFSVCKMFLLATYIYPRATKWNPSPISSLNVASQGKFGPCANHVKW